jgi:hypothetical protein
MGSILLHSGRALGAFAWTAKRFRLASSWNDLAAIVIENEKPDRRREIVMTAALVDRGDQFGQRHPLSPTISLNPNQNAASRLTLVWHLVLRPALVMSAFRLGTSSFVSHLIARSGDCESNLGLRRLPPRLQARQSMVKFPVYLGLYGLGDGYRDNPTMALRRLHQRRLHHKSPEDTPLGGDRPPTMTGVYGSSQNVLSLQS